MILEVALNPFQPRFLPRCRKRTWASKKKTFAVLQKAHPPCLFLRTFGFEGCRGLGAFTVSPRVPGRGREALAATECRDWGR